MASGALKLGGAGKYLRLLVNTLCKINLEIPHSGKLLRRRCCSSAFCADIRFIRDFSLLNKVSCPFRLSRKYEKLQLRSIMACKSVIG